ncbi:MAG TPA: DUF3500 domain-containing protein [Acidimicrobiales bacterium]|nr:DUF3500 domain-containing protein [Acidimicrobiales bacterium]
MDKPHPAEAAANAARRLLDRLDPTQLAAATAPFDSERNSTRRDWHYIPRERPGVCLADLPALEQKYALELLATGFSVEAYAVACAVMSLEDPLDVLEGGVGPRRYTGRRGWGRHRGEYHVIVFGDPGSSEWGWRFEGHHVSVTMTVVGGETVTVPHFLGSNPAEIGALRLLPREEDLALELLATMAPADRSKAIVSDVAPDDILSENAPVVDREVLPVDQGIELRALDPAAQRVATRLVESYLAREPQSRPVDSGALRFAFAGEPARRRPQYYRLHSDDLLIEYDNTQNEANHVHTVVRRPGLDFGDDLLRRHRSEHSH